MSVSNQTNRVSAVGNGSQTAFTFAFKIFAKTDLDVYKVVTATGVATLQTVDVDYTVVINTVTEGGTVTFTVAPTAAQTSLITRVMDYTQPTVIPTESNFPEKSVENELDRGRMVDIQLKEITDRCVKLPLSSSLSDVLLPTPEAGKLLAWNDDEDALENVDNAGPTGPTGPTGSIEDLTPTPSSDLTASGIRASLTAGENVVFGDVCYIKSDGKLWKADANAATLYPAFFMAVATILADASGSFLMLGFARNDAWTWTVGGAIYLSTTVGAMTQTQPSATDDVIQVLGFATHADRMLFKPSSDYMVHA